MHKYSITLDTKDNTLRLVNLKTINELEGIKY